MDADSYHRQPHSVAGNHIRWPPRAQRLLGAIQQLGNQWLAPALKQCQTHFDETLYQHAKDSHNHFEQQRCFDSRSQMEKQRAAFTRLFVEHFEQGFARLGDFDPDAQAAAFGQPLSLLGRDEHELDAALSTLAARGDAHHAPILSELAYRLAVLVGAPPLEGDAMPISPASMAAAMHVAMACMDLPLEHRLLLLRSFEQTMLLAVGSLYQVVNAELVRDGLLPQLRPYVAPRSVHRGAGAGAAEADASAGEADNTASAAGDNSTPVPLDALETLRALLSQRRLAAGAPASGGQAASLGELQSALGTLQQHLTEVSDQASRELRSAQHLRDELLLQLNANKPADAARTHLSAEQDDTVELVAMLFEQLGKQLHHGPHARSVLSDLQLPVLRMAVDDRDFFEQREHPARRLLGAVAEAANDWLDGPEGEADHQLGERLQQLVSRAQQEPPSAGLYTSLLADIEHQLALLNRRAQAAERRHVEAMQGREKLDQSRQRANELLAERYASHPPRGLLRALLDRAWSDVLSLTLLQHGEDSPAFAQRLRVTDQLLGRQPVDDPELLRMEVQAGLQQIGMHAEEASQVALRLIGDEPEVPAPINAASVPAPALASAAASASQPPTPRATTPDEALTRIAAPAPVATTATPPSPAASPVAKPITPSARPATAELPSATDLALRLKQRHRLGEAQHGKPGTDPDEPPLGPQEARIHNRLRQLPANSWFEFTDPATGEASQRKLAWFSPISGKSLFVTRRGLRAEEMNLRELTRAMLDGRVRELPPRREGMLDRAWHSLTGNLLRGGSAATGARP